MFIINFTESITLAVDDKTYGTIYPPSDGFASLSSNLQIVDAHRWRSGTKFAPFDKEVSHFLYCF